MLRKKREKDKTRFLNFRFIFQLGKRWWRENVNDNFLHHDDRDGGKGLGGHKHANKVEGNEKYINLARSWGVDGQKHLKSRYCCGMPGLTKCGRATCVCSVSQHRDLCIFYIKG